MKKAIFILVIGLFWCNTSYALTFSKCYEAFEGSFNSEVYENRYYEIDFNRGTVTQATIYTDDFFSRVSDAGAPKYKTLPYQITFVDENIIAAERIHNKTTKLNINIDIKLSTVSISSTVKGVPLKGYTVKCDSDKDSGSSGSEIAHSGSGFFINNKGYFVTNYHVVAECNDKSKITFKEEEIDAKLIAKDKSLDLALLRAKVKPKDYLKISNERPEKLQKIIVAGYPFGKGLSDDLKFTQGIISSLKGYGDNSNEIQIDAAINPGNSGGPIVNEDGELVAVVVSGLAKDQSEGINFGIKASSVKNFLDVNSAKFSDSGTISFGFSNKKLNQLLENATIYTFCN